MFPVMILAGGLATRLRPLTEKVPKSLIEVNGEPFIAHQLRLLRDQGIDQVVLCTGFLGEQIEAYLGHGERYGMTVQYSQDGATPLGTGGAVRKALPLVNGPFFVLYGDSYLPCDYPSVQQAFRSAGKAGLMTVFRNQGKWDKSNVEFRGGQILAYDKKSASPAMEFIDYGLGVFNPEVFARHAENQPFDLAGVYQDLLARSELAACEVTQRFYEIGSFTGIEELGEYLMTQAKVRA